MENYNAKDQMNVAELIAEAIDRNTEQISILTEAVREMRDSIRSIASSQEDLKDYSNPDRNTIRH